MPAMVEDSPEGFIAAWKPYAAEVLVFSRVEGSPLLECMAAGKVMQVFERTAPYQAPPGPVALILNPTALQLEVSAAGKDLQVLGISRIRAVGEVLARQHNVVVVEVGVPLVVVVEQQPDPDIQPGSYVAFESVPPIHAFVLDRRRQNARRELDDDGV